MGEIELGDGRVEQETLDEVLDDLVVDHVSRQGQEHEVTTHPNAVFEVVDIFGGYSEGHPLVLGA